MLAMVNINLRKAWIGWWLDGRWCPTRNIRDHALRKRYGPTAVIRVEMAESGYPLDHMTDEQIEATVKKLGQAARGAAMTVAEAQRRLLKLHDGLKEPRLP